MENPIRMDDLGVPPFAETSIYLYIYIHTYTHIYICVYIYVYIYIYIINNIYIWYYIYMILYICYTIYMIYYIYDTIYIYISCPLLCTNVAKRLPLRQLPDLRAVLGFREHPITHGLQGAYRCPPEGAMWTILHGMHFCGWFLSGLYYIYLHIHMWM